MGSFLGAKAGKGSFLISSMGMWELDAWGLRSLFDYSVGVKESETEAILPKAFSLSQNYPNPFNPITTIKYALPEACHVKLTVYNILGRRVASLVDDNQKAGYKSVRWDVGSLSSGIYFYRLQAGDFVQTRKMVLLK